MNKHSVAGTVRTVFRLFDKATQRQIRVLFGWMLCGAVLEMLGTAALVGFLDMISHPEVPPVWLPAGTSMILVGSALAALFVVKNAFILVVVRRQNAFAQTQQSLFSAALMQNYLDRPYSYHLDHNSSELLNKIVSQTPLLFLGALLPFLEMALELLRSTGTLIILASTDLAATVGTVLFLGLLAGLFFRVIQKRLVLWGAEIMLGFRHCYQAVNQGLGAVKEAKVLGREGFFVERFRQHSLATAEVRALEATVTQLPQLFLEAIVVVGLVAVIAIELGFGRSLAEVATLLSIFAIAAFRLVPSINKIVGCASQIKASSYGVGEVATDLAHLDLTLKAVPPPATPLTFTTDLRLEGLSYAYPNGKRQALTGVDLVIERGQSVALVGPSGAGKTTLADVILGLLRPTAGHMLVDGQDVLGDLRAWQARIGYVPQTIYLTDDTLRRNIALGLPDHLIDEEKLANAISLAQLTQVIEHLPEGLETMCGENGVRLSGGQRQRVGIARAVYHMPEMLVLDEATSALDNALEREVSLAIQRLGGKLTIVIVAHRLSTARKCDKVVLMKAGRVEDEGPFDVLAERSPDMRRLVELGALN